MICVCIGRGRHKHLVAEHAHLVEQGVQLVEMRLDIINGPIKLRRLLDNRPGPIIITIRRQRDGGSWKGTEEERLMIIRQAIAEGVDYVDLEEDIAGAIPRFGKTKRIISHHDFQETPADLESVHARLAALAPDIVKIATMANSPRDNLRALQLVANAETPTTAFCMGDMGTPSRILCGRAGAPFTYASFHHERLLAPGQIGFRQMIEQYRYDQIDNETEIYGVVADPVGHSHSPLVHNTAFASQDHNAVYLPFRVPREHLADFLADAPKLGVRGLSVTIPHKEAILAAATSIDHEVEKAGAGNTLLFNNGDVSVFNTDLRAALKCLEEAVGSPEALSGRAALVLGAGGAAKAIAYGLASRKMRVTISGRTLSRAQDLARRINCQAVGWDQRHSVQPDVLVNCTPVGMHPNVDESPYDEKHLHANMLVFDTVYNPENTLLVKQAKEHQARVVTGVDMFIGQAALQYQLFTGSPAPVDAMREALKRATSAVRYA